MAKGKKKTNPNKIPIDPKSLDVTQITNEATSSMVLRGWALVLGALANFSETTPESLTYIWRTANAYSSKISDYHDISEELKYIEKAIGFSMPYERISMANIKTQGDLDKVTRKIHKNALYSAFILIAHPIVQEKLFNEDDVRKIFQKAYSLDDDILRRRIKLSDIQEMLADEYGIVLYDDNGHVCLRSPMDQGSGNEEPAVPVQEPPSAPSLDEQIHLAGMKSASGEISVSEADMQKMAARADARLNTQARAEFRSLASQIQFAEDRSHSKESSDKKSNSKQTER